MPKITFSGLDETFEVPVGASLLDACEENGAPVPFSCTSGVCGTCAIVITEGADQVDPITDDEESTLSFTTDEAGARLACMLTVNGDIEIKLLD